MQKLQKNEALKIGTNLDDRYKIIRVLGAGGFGITYEAVNERIHLHVAIKELFVRTYMRRMNGDMTVTVSPGEKVQDHESEQLRKERLRHDKESFLREARIIGTFENEPGIVHVLDYFEANGTAYIVMEYLEGLTLRDYQMQHGAFKSDEIFTKMLPVMETLSKIHEAGVIHRDISPDNIMVMKDGSLRLMDFGAAAILRPDKGEEYSEEAQVKDGYAPIEQYKNEKTDNVSGEGPWTDVYALAATIYTCMTGVIPPSALMRSAYDELKWPSALAVSIRPRLEKILLKGMSVKPEDRFQSIADFYHSVLTTLPAGLRKKRRKKRKIFLAMLQIGAAAAVVCGIWYARTHEVRMKFRGKPTETIWISAPDDMTAKDFFKNEKVLRQRLNAFLGKDNYILKDSGEEIRVTFPSEALRGQDLKTVAERYLTASWRKEICVEYPLKDNDGSAGYSIIDTGAYLNKGDLSDWKKEKSDDESVPYEGKISEDLQEKLKKINVVSTFMEPDAFNDPAIDESRTYLDPEKGTVSVDLKDVPTQLRELALFELSHESMTDNLECSERYEISWEDPESVLDAGSHEVGASFVDENPVILKYAPAIPDYSDETVSEGEKSGAEVVLRNRLDALGGKYAFGTDPDGKGCIYVKINRGDILSAEAELLPINKNDITSSGSEDPDEGQYTSWLQKELAYLKKKEPEESMKQLGALLEEIEKEDIPSGLYGYKLEGVYETGDKTHTGRETELKEGRLAYQTMFDTLSENAQEMGGKTNFDEESFSSINLRVEFSDIKKEELADQAVSMTKELVGKVSEEEWTHKSGSVQLLFSDGEEFGNSIYVSIRKDTAQSEEGKDNSLKYMFRLYSWNRNSFQSEIENDLKSDSFWNGKVENVKERTCYDALR